MSISPPGNRVAGKGVAAQCQLSSSDRWARFFPFLVWARGYTAGNFSADVVAGIVVALLLIPQGMAYAMLANLPPQVGLYASLLPALLYPVFGTSRYLAVGPVAMMSLLVAGTIGVSTGLGLSPVLVAAGLAVLAGVAQVVLGLLRLGELVNFLSHPVLSGFTNGAAILIALSQLKHLLGISLPQTEKLHLLMQAVFPRLAGTNWSALLAGTATVLFLAYFSRGFRRQLKGWKVPETFREPLAKSGPIIVIATGALCVWAFDLTNRTGLKIVGEIPAGLPDLAVPRLDLHQWLSLGTSALVIVFVGFLESVSVAKSLAARRRQRIEPNQELVALGVANLAAGFSGGYPVTGGFSRSVVNYNAGAHSGVASLVTGLLIGATLLWFTGLFFYLPQAVLAGIILVAVAGLVRPTTLAEIWRYSWSDAVAWIITFLAVLFLGIEFGILLGVAVSLAFFLWRSSRPYMAIIGRVGDSEHFRNVLHYQVHRYPEILLIRIDGSLFFANTRHFEQQLLCWLAEQKTSRSVVLVCSAVNFIDYSAIETLSGLLNTLREQGIGFFLAEVKAPVLKQLQGSRLLEEMGETHVFLSVDAAVKALSSQPAKPNV